MTDLFAAYADTAIPEPVRRRQEKAELSPLEKKMAEKQRLHLAYRQWRRQHIRDVLTAEPRLLDFKRYLRRSSDGDELIDAIRESWLPAAERETRILALRMVDGRCDKVNRSLGFAPLDDPLPPDTNVYFRARALLHAGGRA